MIFSRKQYLFFIITMIILIVVSYNYIDRDVSMYFIHNADIYREFGKTMSAIGESHWYFATAILGALYYTYIKQNPIYKQRFLFLLYINLFSGLISLIAKIFFGRLRPWKLEEPENSYGFLVMQNPDFTLLESVKFQINILIENSTPYVSFPSGHTTTSMAVFTYMMILFPRYLYLWFSITLVSITSRVLANDHFISDLMAGTLVGVISTLYIYSKMKDKIAKNY
ncbi:MAG: phosphatase PAP2 family protein [Campylobacterota bacterium]|nr:phosphatase PAP2 family protein [Campylobacterota bacterium]